MVYPRRDGSRSLAKFVALCAVTSCLLHGGAVAKAHRKQAPSVANSCQSLSEGDAAAGILVVSDASCIAGGIGCIDNSPCRFCKTKDTPKSSQFLECSTIGWTAAPTTAAVATPTTAPVVVDPSSATVSTPAPAVSVAAVDTKCPYDVSSGDFAVGIQLVGDVTCAHGGLGCFQNTCRYCKYRDTPQSSHLRSCEKLGYKFSTTTAGTTSPAVVDSGASATTDSPATAAVDTGCPYAVSDGDASVGIQLVGDATCVKGGVGCFADICRFCQVKSTPQSAHLTKCKDLGVDFGAQPAATAAPATAAPATVPVTVPPATTAAVVVPATTLAPATPPTTVPVTVPVVTVVAPATAAPATPPVPTTASVAPPVTSAPEPIVPSVDPTFAPADIIDPSGNVTTGCPYPVSDGDFKVGIQLVGDSTCANGGLGCFRDVCRFCQFRKTPQSGHLMACSSLGHDFAAGSGASDPSSGTDSPTVPVANPTTDCPYPVSDGDLGVGIQLVGDATCATGGLGCFKKVCRFCKVKETPQSKHLLNCTDLGYPHAQGPTVAVPATTPASGSATTPTELPTDVPATTPASGSATTPTELPTPTPATVPSTAPDSATPSISTPEPNSPSVDPTFAPVDIIDPTASPDVFDGSNTDETPEPTPTADTIAPPADNTVAPPADDTVDPPAADTAAPPADVTAAPPAIDTVAPPADVTAAPPADNTVAPPADATHGTGCLYPVSDDDYSVGIQLVGDASCVEGGLGCFKDMCRFCQFRKTPQSGHLMSCKSLGYDLGSGSDATEPPTTDAPVDTPVDSTTGCPYPVSDGDFAVGIQLVGDATCVSGGLGCFKGVCRFCQFQATPQSQHLMSCGVFGYPHTDAPTFAPADITDAPPTGDDGSNDAAPTDGPDIYDGSNTDEVPPPYDTTAPPAVDTVAPPSDNTVAPPIDVTVAPPPDDTASPPADNTVAPPADGSVALPADDTAAPPADDTAAPPADATHGTGCLYPVSDGDYSVGIQLVGDASCVEGGLGCFKDVCRFCQFRKTPQSGHLMSCKSLGYDISSGSDVSDPTTTDAPVETPVDTATDCPYPVSDGDFAVGIQLVGDATCSTGGLGCFKGVCRFCKFQETPLSQHLMSCGAFGYPHTDAPTFAPADITDAPPTGDDGSNDAAPTDASTTCPLSVTEGDSAVGIQLVTDATCVNGGLGCVADVCRFCKFRDTPQSSHLLDCASFSQPSASDGIPISQPNNTNTTSCPFKASEGDLYIGVQIISDTTCDIGGVGCFHDACRFCKFFDTDKSSHLEDCTTFGYNFEPVATTAAPRPGATTVPPPATAPPAVDVSNVCDQTVSEGDKKVGIDMVTDASCLVGGIGCVADSVCRFCKVVETAANGHMEWCSKITGIAETPAPVDTVDTPAPVVSVTSEPTTATPAAAITPCDQVASEGNKNVGIDMVTDGSCVNGGVGCLPDSTCRYCKRAETAASSHLQWCPGVDPSAAPVVTAAPVDAVTPPADVVTAPPAPAASGVDASAPCDQTVSQGDADEGIALATDPTCADGGLGCLDKSTCRYCKRWVTAASAHLDWCAGYDGYVQPPAATTEPVVVADPTTTPAPTLDPSTCSTEVSDGDAAAGVAAVHDEQCLSGGIGCFGGVCRFCQVFETDKSANFLPCASMVSTIAPLRAAAKIRSEATSFKGELDKLFKDKTYKGLIFGFGCVGAVAVVALFGLGAKRAMTRKRSHPDPAPVDEPAEDTETEVDAATVPPVGSSLKKPDDVELDEVDV